MSFRGDQRGNAAVEWAGALLVVSVVIGAVVTQSIPAKTVAGVRCEVTRVFGSGGSCGRGRRATGSAPGGSRSAPAAGAPASAPAAGVPTSAPAAGAPTSARATGTRGAPTPTAPETKTCPPGTVQEAPPALVGVCVAQPPCPARRSRAQGPVLPGRTLPCVPDAGPTVPTAKPPPPPPVGQEINPDPGMDSCGPGWNFHYYQGTAYCAWGAIDPDPTKLGEDPGDVAYWAASKRTGKCPIDPEKVAQKELSRPMPPHMAPATRKSPYAVLMGPDPQHRSYVLFPYGKSEYQLYMKIFNQLWTALKGIPRKQLETDTAWQTIEQEALARAQTQAAASAPPAPTGGGNGEGDGGENRGGEGEEPDPEPPIEDGE